MRTSLTGMLQKAKEKVGGVGKRKGSKGNLLSGDGDDLACTSRLDTMFFASPDDRTIAMDKT